MKPTVDSMKAGVQRAVEMVRGGPEQRAAQARLDEVQQSGKRLTVDQAERLSDAVYEGRDRDRAARHAERGRGAER